MLNLLTLLPAKTYFNVVQKPLELMTYKFVTFLKYELTRFDQIFSSIRLCLMHYIGAFWLPGLKIQK